MGKRFDQSNQYELMAAFYFTLGHKGFEEELTTVREEIASHGGKVIFENIWGKRDLMYRIKRQDQAYYVVLDFTIEAEDLLKLKKELELNQKILRYLLVKLPADYQPKTSFEPFFLVPPKEKKEEKVEVKPTKAVRKVPLKAAPAIKEPEIEEVAEAETEVPETIETPVVEEVVEVKEKASAKKSAATPAKGKQADPNFDQKLDEIIENLDNL